VSALLEVSDVYVAYGATRVLHGVSMQFLGFAAHG